MWPIRVTDSPPSYPASQIRRCKYRVSSSKQKITVTLAKADKNEGWHELRKKVPKFCK